ncbi:unnamed protein product [Trichogramma brassicae]|uniref:Uncharacterized protein n=1 Tax=Trichogramma brassicae TaxID=86971 RepID=A0A6H5HZS8_9HYME|nr:unnamed protein product [Trichogramma brassicae]
MTEKRTFFLEIDQWTFKLLPLLLLSTPTPTLLSPQQQQQQPYDDTYTHKCRSSIGLYGVGMSYAARACCSFRPSARRQIAKISFSPPPGGIYASRSSRMRAIKKPVKSSSGRSGCLCQGSASHPTSTPHSENWSNSQPIHPARGRGRGRYKLGEISNSSLRPGTPDESSSPSSRSDTPNQGLSRLSKKNEKFTNLYKGSVNLAERVFCALELAVHARQCRESAHLLLICCGDALMTIERLEKRGFELDRNDILTIMALFAKYELFEKSVDVEKCWYRDEEFVSEAKQIMIRSLSLYDLMQLQPDEAAKKLTYENYYWFATGCKFWLPSEKYHEATSVHMCEKMLKGFFRRWALEYFLELTRYRLPILCCEMIIKQLINEDLWHICQVAEDQISRAFSFIVILSRKSPFASVSSSIWKNSIVRYDIISTKFRINLLLVTIIEMVINEEEKKTRYASCTVVTDGLDQRIAFVALRAATRLHAVGSVQARSSQGSFNGATFDRTISRCAVLPPAGERICIRSSFTRPKNSIRKRRRRRCEREAIKGEERQERNVRKKNKHEILEDE